MEQFVWLMDQWRVLAQWRSASMECGEQCVSSFLVTGITMMPELCADNWGTVSTQVEVSSQSLERQILNTPQNHMSIKYEVLPL